MALTVETRFDQLKKQTEFFLAAGFHQEVGESSQEYISYIDSLISEALFSSQLYLPGTQPGLVEPRIPFERQLSLLGITLDPSVLYYPRTDRETPYIASLKVISRNDPLVTGLTLADMVKGLSNDLQPANAFEAIANYAEVTQGGFVAIPGEEYYRTPALISERQYHPRFLCLDRFLGKPRLADISKDSTDRSVGILARIKKTPRIPTVEYRFV